MHGFSDYKVVDSNLHTFTGNLGLTREYENNLSYKNGTRSWSCMISAGFISKSILGLFRRRENNCTVGIQVLNRYCTGSEIYEPVYTKMYIYIDKIESQQFLYRLGFSLCFDMYFLYRYVGGKL